MAKGRWLARCLAGLALLPATVAAGDGVALVLSGGGARGVAHLGVLKVLEELRVPVDCVVGTSMGAIVGASYASGVTLEALERRVREADWPALFSNTTPRDEQPFREKQDAASGHSAITMGFGDGRVLMPHSAIAGQQLDRFLQELVGASEALSTFDTLALPFRAMATDLVTGEPVELASGPLWRAMRTSMAVPGAFLPIAHGDRLLVDGGLAMNLPVSVGRRLCGPHVIAVDVGTPPLPRERLRSAADIVLQAIHLALGHNVAAERAQLGAGDVLVEVDIGDMVSSDFDRVLETIPAGETSARAMAAELKRFSVDERTYALWKRQREARWHLPEPVIRAVRLPPLRFVSPEAMRARLGDLAGRQLDVDELEQRLSRLYSDGDYERLRYSVVRDGADADLAIEAIEKSWGPTYLRFGGGLASDFDGGGVVSLYAGLSRHWLNRWGARADVDLVLGTNNSLRAEFYQPLGLKSNWFVAPQLRISTQAVPVYVDDIRLAEYKVRQRSAGLELGYELGAWGELRAGVHRGSLHADLLTGLPLYPAVNIDDGWVGATAILDRLDSPFFPRRGYGARIELQHHHPDYGSDLSFAFSVIEGDMAFSYGEHSLRIGLLAAGSPDQDLPAAARSLIGGPFALSGYRYGELAADQIVLLRNAYYRRVSRLPDSIGRGVYLGATYEWADLSNYASGAEDEVGQATSVSLFAGADTVIGPLYLGAGYAPEVGEVRFYLLLGEAF
ncbi:MAG: patatin-like phospholipase family protein [Rhodocyclaceae bacterium]|nr:patatin-like phospholipase family protein [Rhodocyclaceae bacterium]